MKPIQLTDEAKSNALEIFKRLLEEQKGTDLNIKITADTLIAQQNIQKPTVFATAQAYAKMMTLINENNKELAWHGVAVRVGTNYLIEDILVYPQTVTNSTVDADEEAYAKWLMALPDEVLNHLRFQGHSHVKMNASPSGRDTGNWEKFIDLIEPDDFYLFCIGNQSADFYWTIYDKKLNVQFENKDITFTIIDEKGNSIPDWCSDMITKYIKDEPKITHMGFTKTNTPTTITTQTTDSVKDTNKSVLVNSSNIYKDATDYIPTELHNIVDYDIETDVYYIEDKTVFQTAKDIPNGFHYSNLFDCYISYGEQFRKIYAKNISKKKNKTNNKKKRGETK